MIRLSPRQKQIHRLFLAGKRTPEIAKEVRSSPNSVTMAIQRMRKAGVDLPYRHERKKQILFTLNTETGEFKKLKPASRPTHNAARHASIKNQIRAIRNHLDKIEALTKT